ncbi:hypothetical protein [Rhizobium glycinendophyticum]|uniref:Uncharacterized protein n=1 Tax=Rhizobium glycinendophyticum TaxID=2589807 RepID=A0A504U774_9HYPH|nr:hypothetical protein [Rhizobium glycinendophyticum]TPP10894.1 hypothetical protein FJQ55_08655 [Rhizobium glycinendophyticum]
MLRVLVALALCLPIAGCDLFGFHDWEWRQKLTVSVMTPEGLKTGSAVVSVNVYDRPSWWGLGDFRGAGATSLSGEAVTVDLGNGRYLFALLSNYSHETARETFISKEEQPRTKAQAIAVYDRLEKMRGLRELAPENYPLLVTFDDMNDPTTVRRVDPSNLSDSFGPGYRLNAITLSITHESVTEGRVEKLLGWLKERAVMENPGWSNLPLESRRAISELLSHFPSLTN